MGFELKQRTLCCKSLPFPHTADKISDAIAEELVNYEITDKVKFIICDNASNMIKACDILSISTLPCAAHTLQLTVKAAFATNKILIKKARKLVKYFHRSPKQTQRLCDFRKFLKRDKELGLLIDVKTRWNSTIAMIQRLLILYNDIFLLRKNLEESIVKDDLKDGKELESYLLENDELNCLEEILNILNPLKLASEILEGSLYPTISLLSPIIAQLFDIFHNVKSEKMKPIQDAVCNDLNQRWGDFSLDQVIPAYFDLRFKNLEFLGSKKMRFISKFLIN